MIDVRMPKRSKLLPHGFAGVLLVAQVGALTGCVGAFVVRAPHRSREPEMARAAAEGRFSSVIERASMFEQQNLKSRDVHWYRMWRAAAMIGLGQLGDGDALVDEVLAAIAAPDVTVAEVARLRMFGYDLKAKVALAKDDAEDALPHLERALALAAATPVDGGGKCARPLMLVGRYQQIERLATELGEAKKQARARSRRMRYLEEWSACLASQDYPSLHVVAHLSDLLSGEAVAAVAPRARPTEEEAEPPKKKRKKRAKKRRKKIAKAREKKAPPPPPEPEPKDAEAEPESGSEYDPPPLPDQTAAARKPPKRTGKKPPKRTGKKPDERAEKAPARDTPFRPFRVNYAPIAAGPYQPHLDTFVDTLAPRARSVRGDAVIRTDGSRRAIRIKLKANDHDDPETLIALFKTAVLFFERTRDAAEPIEEILLWFDTRSGARQVVARRRDIVDLFVDRIGEEAFLRRLGSIL